MRILVIEDDSVIADAVRRGLAAEGFAVEVAEDGDDGLWMATEGTWDAIVLDLMLPGRDGLAVCRELRAAGRWTPILMLTARDAETDQTNGLDVGADDYLAKPFSFPILVARVRALCRRGVERDSAPVAAGDLRIDPRGRRAWRGETEITLTTRQFDLLEFLVRRSGRVLTRDEIVSGVWGFDFAGDPNIVEVYVRRLRMRIDEPFARHAIETLRGAGYRLAADGG